VANCLIIRPSNLCRLVLPALFLPGIWTTTTRPIFQLAMAQGDCKLSARIFCDSRHSEPLPSLTYAPATRLPSETAGCFIRFRKASSAANPLFSVLGTQSWLRSSIFLYRTEQFPFQGFPEVDRRPPSLGPSFSGPSFLFRINDGKIFGRPLAQASRVFFRIPALAFFPILAVVAHISVFSLAAMRYQIRG